MAIRDSIAAMRQSLPYKAPEMRDELWEELIHKCERVELALEEACKFIAKRDGNKPAYYHRLFTECGVAIQRGRDGG